MAKVGGVLRAREYGSAPMPSMLSYKVMADDNSLFK
jgi:hypothetical protein